MSSRVYSHLMTRLHAQDPYTGLEPEQHPKDAQGWASDDPNFERMLTLYRPSLVVEVGSWKGASALHMGQLAHQLQLDMTLVCVDTWLGAVEHLDTMGNVSLRRLNGFPQLYYTFLSNIVRAGLQHIVVPFPNTSANAGRWLKSADIRPDLVYIDGSHEFSDVFEDLTLYYDVVKLGGAIFGDDYSTRRQVAQAVHLFARVNRLDLEITPNHRQWVIAKKSDRPAVSVRDLLHNGANDGGARPAMDALKTLTARMDALKASLPQSRGIKTRDE